LPREKEDSRYLRRFSGGCHQQEFIDAIFSTVFGQRLEVPDFSQWYALIDEKFHMDRVAFNLSVVSHFFQCLGIEGNSFSGHAVKGDDSDQFGVMYSPVDAELAMARNG
jgi:hypothetical protein